jgi:hypothetical protein
MGKAAARLVLLACVGLFAVGVSPAYAVDLRLGNDVAGSDKRDFNEDTVVGNVYTLGEAGVTESFSMYVKGGNEDQVVKPVLYKRTGDDDSVAGEAGNWERVFVDDEVTVAAEDRARWVTVPLEPVLLEPGEYFVGVLVGPRGEPSASARGGGEDPTGALFFYLEGGTLYRASTSYFEPSTVIDLSPGGEKTLSMFVQLRGPQGPEGTSEKKGPNRAGYCLNGQFLDLELRQVEFDPRYEGAVPAIYVAGKGLTCDPPFGLTKSGLYHGDDAGWDFYEYYT